MTDQCGTMDDVMVTGRDFNPATDEAFVYATWRKGYFFGHPDRKSLGPPSEFFPSQTLRIREILKYAQVRVACLKDAPDVILGCAVLTGDFHLEWIFVKLEFRGKGIARYLTVETKTVSPNLTKIGAAIVKKKNLTIRSIYEQKES